MEGYTGEISFNSNDWENQPKVSLREAAALSNPWNHFITNSCHCTQGCTTKRCRCVQNGIECSAHTATTVRCVATRKMTGRVIKVWLLYHSLASYANQIVAIV